MAQIINQVPKVRHKLICTKGCMHAQEPLDLVCLDPLCRASPLACCVCFSQTHKYHKTLSLDRFLSDYKRNIGVFHKPFLELKISKNCQNLRTDIAELRKMVLIKLSLFEQNIDCFAQHLMDKLKTLQTVSKKQQVTLDPDSLTELSSTQEFNKSISYIISQSMFLNSSMVSIAGNLQQNQDEILAMLDKVIYTTQAVHQQISNCLDQLTFPMPSLRTNHLQLPLGTQFKCSIDPSGASMNTSIINFQPQPQQKQNFKFSKQFRNTQLQLGQNEDIIRSNITALKPQYGLIVPHLKMGPQRVDEWSLKVNRCRNLASVNTLGVGVATLSGMRTAGYTGKLPENCILLTSQGYLHQNGKQFKTALIFGAGDLLHFKYDRAYNLLEIKKLNGHKLTLNTADLPDNQNLYACTRLTYASDQLQIV